LRKLRGYRVHHVRADVLASRLGRAHGDQGNLHFFKKKAAEEAHWARRRGLFGTLKALKSSFTKINLHTITPRAFSLCLRERHFFLCILRTLFDLLTISGRY